MKFGKKLSSKMVPEWQHAYMDYGCLKKYVKLTPATRCHHAEGFKRMCSCLLLLTRRTQRLGNSHDVEEGVPLMTTAPILVETKDDGQVQTKFLMEGGEYESKFFERLDNEFNKVNSFYIEKVKKVLEQEVVVLNEKMEALNGHNELRKAFVGLYRELGFLKSYSSSNVKAFSNILKKYDRKTSRDAKKIYMKVVDSSYLGSSDEVVRLMEHVEDMFEKHFADGNRTKGKKMLRPKATRERHRLTFSTGFSAGCVFSLIVALAAIIRTRNILQHDGQDIYMNTMFPLYSWFVFVMLHIIMYAANLYFWRRYKVNYSKIFKFKQGTELGHRQVLLVAFSIGVFALLCVLANLDMEVDPVTKDYQVYTELLPLFLLLALLLVLAMPFDFFYRSNRKFYLTCLGRCLAAPFCKVTFADSFLGDQFTSQVQALRSFEFYICYYGWGEE